MSWEMEELDMDKRHHHSIATSTLGQVGKCATARGAVDGQVALTAIGGVYFENSCVSFFW